jgi:hypothetical protein
MASPGLTNAHSLWNSDLLPLSCEIHRERKASRAWAIRMAMLRTMKLPTKADNIIPA